MKKKLIVILGLAVCFSISTTCYGAQTITAQKVDKAPAINGIGNDPVWEKVQAIVTHDNIAGIDVTLKVVYVDEEIFFLVTFPDSDESRSHKSWVWNEELEMYDIGPDRGDCFVFKWNMEPEPVDLSVFADNHYDADIWFWKAGRTDSAGYADDKHQTLNFHKVLDAKKITSRSGKTMYLSRKGDDGTSAYKSTIHEDYEGDRIENYVSRVPTGSRADVKSKGIWADGFWTIEFRRSLDTGNWDDVQFDISKSYLFGISRFETGGRKSGPGTNDASLYGAGDVSEELTLTFSQ